MALLAVTVLLLCSGRVGAPWAAWMPPSLPALSGTCVALRCRFDFPEELRPAAVHGLWFFGSPYPKSYPPVVARSRPSPPVHESFVGRARFEGDPTRRDCSLRIHALSPELGGRYYFRGDLGGYNQYSFSEHTNIEVWASPQLEVPTEVVEGTEVELRCRVPDNCPTLRPTLTWTGAEELWGAVGRERREEAEGARALVGLLRFRARREDVGRRVGCNVTFTNSSLRFHADTGLDVHYAPRVTALWVPPWALEGSRVELRCEAEGRPTPQLSWLRDSHVLPHGAPHDAAPRDPRDWEPWDAAPRSRDPRDADPRSRDPQDAAPWNRDPQDDWDPQDAAPWDWDPQVWAPEDAAPRGRAPREAAPEEGGGAAVLSVTLPHAAPHDAALYVCVAENPHGAHNRSAAMRVAYAPRPPLLNGTLRAVAGGGAAVTCVADGDPPPAVSVLRGPRVVAAAVGGVSVAWGAARPEDGGLYECHAQNPHGHQRTPFNLSIEYPPLFLAASRCSLGSDGARCVCAVRAVPAASLWFELPARNVTVSEGHRDFAAAPGGVGDGDGDGEGDGDGDGGGPAVTAAILTLRGALEPRTAVLCAAHNAHGTAARRLRFHHPGVVWAKVGPVGAVVAFAIVIAVVCYLSQSRRKKGAGSPEVTPVQPPTAPGGDPDLDLRPQQARWLRGAVERWALGVREGSGAPQEPPPPCKPARGTPEDPPEYAEIRVK